MGREPRGVRLDHAFQRSRSGQSHQCGRQQRRIVFSGDIGQWGKPLIRDPSVFEFADHIVMESTYGDRNHRSHEETLEELGEIFRTASRAHGNILIPAFAVGRSQNLLYYMSKYYDEWGLKGWHIFLDSPMAIRATGVYVRHRAEYDEEARALWGGKKALPMLSNVHFTRTSKQSMAINNIHSGAIIMAGSPLSQVATPRTPFRVGNDRINLLNTRAASLR